MLVHGVGGCWREGKSVAFSLLFPSCVWEAGMLHGSEGTSLIVMSNSLGPVACLMGWGHFWHKGGSLGLGTHKDRIFSIMSNIYILM